MRTFTRTFAALAFMVTLLAGATRAGIVSYTASGPAGGVNPVTGLFEAWCDLDLVFQIDQAALSVDGSGASWKGSGMPYDYSVYDIVGGALTLSDTYQGQYDGVFPANGTMELQIVDSGTSSLQFVEIIVTGYDVPQSVDHVVWLLFELPLVGSHAPGETIPVPVFTSDEISPVTGTLTSFDLAAQQQVANSDIIDIPVAGPILSSVPEPTTLVLLLTGLAGLALFRRTVHRG